MKDLVPKYLLSLHRSKTKIVLPMEAIPASMHELYKAIVAEMNTEEMEIYNLKLPDVDIQNPVEFYAEHLRKEYKQILLVELATIILSTGSMDLELLEKIETIDKTESTEQKRDIMINETLERIRNKNKGKEIPFLKTGFTQLDNLASLDMKQIILMAAEKKLGKTKFIIFLAHYLMDKYKLPVRFFALEPAYDEIIRCMISIITGIPEILLLGRRGGLTEEALRRVERVTAEIIGDLPFEIIDDVRNIKSMTANLRGFKGIVVVDNLGLVESDTRNENAHNEAVAKAFVRIRDKTGSLIFILHHLTKDASSDNNLETGYMPRSQHVRGSGRIQDYSNQIWLLHRPSFYKDLMLQLSKTVTKSEYQRLKKLFLIDVHLNRHGETALCRSYCDLSTSIFTDPWAK